MSFMEKLRGQLIDIVEFLDESRDTIVWRFPRQGNEIKNQAKLVVREGQSAVFVSEGRLADVFGPGTYTLETKNLPILSTLQGWKHGFSSPFKAEVYFVTTRQLTDLTWGTQNPVILRDPELGAVRLRAFGTYALQVVDPAALLRQLVGTDPQFRTDEIGDYFRRLVVGQLGPALAEAGVAAVDLAANQGQIATRLAGQLSEDLSEYGIAVRRFVLENVSFRPRSRRRSTSGPRWPSSGTSTSTRGSRRRTRSRPRRGTPAARATAWASAQGWASAPPWGSSSRSRSGRRRPRRPRRRQPVRRRCPPRSRPGTGPLTARRRVPARRRTSRVTSGPGP